MMALERAGPAAVSASPPPAIIRARRDNIAESPDPLREVNVRVIRRRGNCGTKRDHEIATAKLINRLGGPAGQWALFSAAYRAASMTSMSFLNSSFINALSDVPRSAARSAR